MIDNVEPCQVLCEEPKESFPRGRAKMSLSLTFFFFIEFYTFQPCSTAFSSCPVDGIDR